MRRLTRFLWSSILPLMLVFGPTVWASVAGCGKVTATNRDAGGSRDGGGTEDGDNTALDSAPEVVLTATQACNQVAVAACDAINSCAAFMVQVLYGDLATCVSRWELGCTGDQSVSGTTRTLADIVACAQAVGTATCTDLLASRLPAVCAIKPGMRVNGAACGSDWQCQSTYCGRAGACGVCGPRADVGGACTVDGGCRVGLVCANPAMNGRCVTPGNVGAPCNATQPCRTDLYCTAAMAGVCASKVGAASSCADSDQACDLVQGVACNAFNKICERVSVAKGGEACGIVNSGLTVCVGLNPCRGISLLPLSLTGACASPAADGAACGAPAPANGTNCVAPAQCEMQICRLSSAAACG